MDTSREQPPGGQIKQKEAGGSEKEGLFERGLETEISYEDFQQRALEMTLYCLKREGDLFVRTAAAERAYALVAAESNDHPDYIRAIKRIFLDEMDKITESGKVDAGKIGRVLSLLKFAEQVKHAAEVKELLEAVIPDIVSNDIRSGNYKRARIRLDLSGMPDTEPNIQRTLKDYLNEHPEESGKVRIWFDVEY